MHSSTRQVRFRTRRRVGSTRRRGNHMHDHSRFQHDIDWRHRRPSLSLLLTKVTHAQYRKRFRAFYNSSHKIATRPKPVILLIQLGGKADYLLLNFGYREVMHTAPILTAMVKVFLTEEMFNSEQAWSCTIQCTDSWQTHRYYESSRPLWHQLSSRAPLLRPSETYLHEVLHPYTVCLHRRAEGGRDGEREACVVFPSCAFLVLLPHFANCLKTPVGAARTHAETHRYGSVSFSFFGTSLNDNEEVLEID